MLLVIFVSAFFASLTLAAPYPTELTLRVSSPVRKLHRTKLRIVRVPYLATITNKAVRRLIQPVAPWRVREGPLVANLLAKSYCLGRGEILLGMTVEPLGRYRCLGVCCTL